VGISSRFRVVLIATAVAVVASSFPTPPATAADTSSPIEVAALDASAAAPQLDAEPTGDFSNPPGAPMGARNSTRVREVVAERSATTKVFENSDGSRTMEISTRPVNYQQDGAWLPIDNSIVADRSSPGTAAR